MSASQRIPKMPVEISRNSKSIPSKRDKLERLLAKSLAEHRQLKYRKAVFELVCSSLLSLFGVLF